jgi:hypothetical protein
MENQIITNPAYFDCECPQNYIHKKSESPKCRCCKIPEAFCPQCGYHESEQPDSMQSEIDAMNKG